MYIAIPEWLGQLVSHNLMPYCILYAFNVSHPGPLYCDSISFQLHDDLEYLEYLS